MLMPRIILTLCCCLALELQAQAVTDPVASAIEAEIAALTNPEVTTLRGAKIAFPDRIHDFYSRRGFRPAWSNADIAAQLLKAIEDSYAEGLDPADYYLPLLKELSGQVASPAATEQLRAQYDMLLTEALLRLAYHLSFGKVDPESFDAQWNYGRTLAGDNVAQVIEEAIAAADIYNRIEARKPSHPMYTRLRDELARYREIERAGGWAAVPAGPSLKTGANDPRVPALRARLIASRDLPEAARSDSPMFDADLEAAVRKYQQRLGLDADGAAGPSTLAELNVPVAQRIEQLRVNLDRGRVLLHDLPAEFVVVNIASFTVYFIRGTETVWNARAQVGRTYRRTPIFRSEITYLVWNPTWTVPPGIIAKDILPEARRDPSSITRRKLKVLDSSGREVDPASVDWSRFKNGHIPYTLRQDPGPANALGRVKLMFPNPYLVYLHDTPSQALFERSERTYSSGCVRVERATELAEMVLNDPQNWNRASIARLLESTQLQNVTLRKKVPVLLAYWTAWADAEGVMHFRRDIYEQDAKWLNGLAAPFKVRSRPLFSS